MRLYLITPPTEDVITLTEAKAHLRVEDASEDADIQAIIDAAVAMLDPASGGYLDKALRPQTWELRLNGFPCNDIKLPFSPLISVDSVKYDDASGTEQTLALTTGYRKFTGGLGQAIIVPPYNGSWPVARCDLESVRIRFTAGHAASNDASSGALDAVKSAVKLIVGHLYQNREQISDAEKFEMPLGVAALLSSFKIHI